MSIALRAAWRGFLDLVYGDSVRPFVWLYYVPLMIFGVAAIVITVVLTYVGIPSAALTVLWIWVQVPATCAAMIGLWLRHGGTPIDEMNGPPSFRDWIGLLLQFGGHACMAVVLVGFELVAGRVVALGPFGVATDVLGVLIWWIVLFAMAAISSYVIGCSLLSLQVALKIGRLVELRPR